MSVKVIAEAGINHNCNIQNAFELVDAAIDAGADIIKFKAAIPEEVVTKQGEMAKYQIKNIGKKLTQLEMTKKIHFALSSFKEIYYYSKKKGIEFCSTSFGEKATEYLSSFDMPFWKIPSGEINNIPYLRQIAFQKKPIILSTGMSNISEIEFALEILQESGHDRNLITLLHCTSEYPANKKEINLSAIQTLKNTFKVNVGYSDHSLATNKYKNFASMAAIYFGANFIERHITILNSNKTKDGVVSINPEDIAEVKNFAKLKRNEMLSYLKDKFKINLNQVKGNSKRKLSHEELLNRDYYRGRFCSKINIGGQTKDLFNWEEEPNSFGK